MNKNNFLSSLENPTPLVADGAMGTMLHQRGFGFEQCFDSLNLTQPSSIAGIHREYIDAGAQIIISNTFGANRHKLSRHGLEDRVNEINQAGIDLAQKVISASFKQVFLAGDVGPLGARLAPFGRIQPESAKTIFREQISALVNKGVDLLIIETMTDLYEIEAAIQAAKLVDDSVPILASMTFTRDDRTLLGDDPAKVARRIKEFGAQVIGVNCSGGPAQLLRILKHMKLAVPDAYFSIMPNAGWPEQVSGRIFYPATPDYFSHYAVEFWLAGANIIGGCCGTTPKHIAAIATGIREYSPAQLKARPDELQESEETEEEIAESPSEFSKKIQRKKFVVSVEMDPPRGLTTQKLLAGASLLAEAGVDAIDVADSPMARMRMSPWAVCNLLQHKLNLETILHFPTRGRNILRVQGDLLAAHAIGVRNVLVLMGDPTAIGDYPDAMDNFDLVPSGLIKLIKQGFNMGLDHSGNEIGAPTSFFVGGALTLDPGDLQQEFNKLNKKIKAGLDFVMTQPIYDPEIARKFLSRYKDLYGPFPVPLLIGIWPFASERHANFIHQEIPGITVPESILRRLEGTGSEGSKIGTRIAIELVQELKLECHGIYLVPPFNRYDIIAEIIDIVKGS